MRASVGTPGDRVTCGEVESLRESNDEGTGEIEGETGRAAEEESDGDDEMTRGMAG